ncbi:MAG TPA: hypothetical protein VGL77_02465 [Armatimonadota bacterium]|jgi:hypothetical protein
MASVACSLHLMDVRLLRMFVSAMQGGPIPDLKAEVTRCANRDILLSWSRKIAHAAAPLADGVPREKWTLYTQFRPFFITTDDPLHAAELTERLFSVQNLDDALNLFREEVARIDPERADAIIDAARQDNSAPVMAHQSVDTIVGNFRAYLLYERRQLEALTSAAAAEAVPPAQLREAGRRLAWRTCNLLANLHPSWSLRSANLTNLASRNDLGIETLVADPRGMYAAIAQRIPGLHEHIPFRLEEGAQTGLCIAPKAIHDVLSLMERWPQPIMPHPTLGVPTPGEIQALREALIYAERQQAGLWEASGLSEPALDIFPQILMDQGEREDKPEKYAVMSSVLPVAEDTPATSGGSIFAQKWGGTAPATDDAVGEFAETPTKTSWLTKFFKKKSANDADAV